MSPEPLQVLRTRYSTAYPAECLIDCNDGRTYFFRETNNRPVLGAQPHGIDEATTRYLLRYMLFGALLLPWEETANVP